MQLKSQSGGENRGRGSGGKEGREVIREREEENSRLLRVDSGSRFEKSFKAH